MFGFDADALPEHAAPIHEKSGPVGWGVWEAHRPGAAAQDGAALTVQAAPDWSEEHLSRIRRQWQRRCWQHGRWPAERRSGGRAIWQLIAGAMHG